MTFVKINNTLYPTIEINGYMVDHNWNGRASKSITLEMSIDSAKELFINDAEWFIVEQNPVSSYVEDPETESMILVQKIDERIYENSNYSVAGDIIDHRNGVITVKMGMPTADELLEMLLEGVFQ